MQFQFHEFIFFLLRVFLIYHSHVIFFVLRSELRTWVYSPPLVTYVSTAYVPAKTRLTRTQPYIHKKKNVPIPFFDFVPILAQPTKTHLLSKQTRRKSGREKEGKRNERFKKNRKKMTHPLFYFIYIYLFSSLNLISNLSTLWLSMLSPVGGRRLGKKKVDSIPPQTLSLSLPLPAHPIDLLFSSF